jgi:predicted dehydrogenase
MKTAIIGLGVIGKVHYQVLQELSNAPVAICDVDESKMDGYVGARFTDYRKMIDEIKPDVVHICTPHYLHAQMTIFALSENINVFCEKPLCIDLNDIPKILEAEKRSKAILGVSMQNRYNASNLYVKEYLKDKQIKGAVGYMSWKRDMDYYNSGAWRGKWATEGGGVLINQALHTFDIMQWLTSYPKSITAKISNLSMLGQIEVEDTVTVMADCGDYKFNFFASNSNSTNFPVHVTIRTNEGDVTIMGDKVIIDGELKVISNGEHFYGKLCYGNGHEYIIRDFYDCIKTGRKFELDGAEASKVIKMILATYSSNGEAVKI